MTTQVNVLDLAQRISLNDRARLLLLLAEARRQALHGEGDFIELGVFHGGSALLLAFALKEARSARRLQLLDSWEGLPPPGPDDAGTFVGEGVFAAASEGAVGDLLARLQLAQHCQLRRGWFASTLPPLQGPFALAHVDCDLHDSVKLCLDHLLPRMTPRGTIVVDDYGTPGQQRFPGVAKAVQEAIAGTPWRVLPLGGNLDQSVLLIRQ